MNFAVTIFQIHFMTNYHLKDNAFKHGYLLNDFIYKSLTLSMIPC